MDREIFQESMGLLGLAHTKFITERIFAIIDSNNDGYVKYYFNCNIWYR